MIFLRRLWSVHSDLSEEVVTPQPALRANEYRLLPPPDRGLLALPFVGVMETASEPQEASDLRQWQLSWESVHNALSGQWPK